MRNGSRNLLAFKWLFRHNAFLYESFPPPVSSPHRKKVLSRRHNDITCDVKFRHQSKEELSKPLKVRAVFTNKFLDSFFAGWLNFIRVAFGSLRPDKLAESTVSSAWKTFTCPWCCKFPEYLLLWKRSKAARNEKRERRHETKVRHQANAGNAHNF